ncbi:hypothetical protein [Embleya sp. NPDC001921]
MTTTTGAALSDAEVAAPSGRIRLAAHAVAWCVVPSGIWRIAMGLGVPVGFDQDVLRDVYDVPGWGTAYTIGLSVLVELAAFATLGLVRPWGRRVPGWVPVFGNRATNPRVVTMVAAGGAAVVALVMLSQLALLGSGVHEASEVQGAAAAVMIACYLPLLAWAPLLAVVTRDFHRRHRPGVPR